MDEVQQHGHLHTLNGWTTSISKTAKQHAASLKKLQRSTTQVGESVQITAVYELHKYVLHGKTTIRKILKASNKREGNRKHLGCQTKPKSYFLDNLQNAMCGIKLLKYIIFKKPFGKT